MLSALRRPRACPREVFVSNRPKRRDDVMAFYNQAGSVRPLAIAAALKNMKALIMYGTLVLMP
jgi:hypothetical protein